MYWRVCLDQFQSLQAIPAQGASPRAGRRTAAFVRADFMNPLRLAQALASPFAGEEGDQDLRSPNHA